MSPALQNAPSSGAKILRGKGYEGLKAREVKIPSPHGKKLDEAGARVVKLYESWGQADWAAEWRKKVEMPAVM